MCRLAKFVFLNLAVFLMGTESLWAGDHDSSQPSDRHSRQSKVHQAGTGQQPKRVIESPLLLQTVGSLSLLEPTEADLQEFRKISQTGAHPFSQLRIELKGLVPIRNIHTNHIGYLFEYRDMNFMTVEKVIQFFKTHFGSRAVIVADFSGLLQSDLMPQTAINQHFPTNAGMSQNSSENFFSLLSAEYLSEQNEHLLAQELNVLLGEISTKGDRFTVISKNGLRAIVTRKIARLYLGMAMRSSSRGTTITEQLERFVEHASQPQTSFVLLDQKMKEIILENLLRTGSYGQIFALLNTINDYESKRQLSQIVLAPLLKEGPARIANFFDTGFIHTSVIAAFTQLDQSEISRGQKAFRLERHIQTGLDLLTEIFLDPAFDPIYHSSDLELLRRNLTPKVAVGLTDFRQTHVPLLFQRRGRTSLGESLTRIVDMITSTEGINGLQFCQPALDFKKFGKK